MIKVTKPHTHETNGNEINLKKNFRIQLVERARNENKSLKIIYEEESVR